ncbi:MAG TPA: tetratricopeptide repeat protein [Bryobacteraceae bacterium]|nr:tetratricopeptide repeat protein [Bryobacteraceae bacterium]
MAVRDVQAMAPEDDSLSLKKVSIGTTRIGAMVSVGLALVLLFAGAVFLTQGYRAIRRGRAEARFRTGLHLADEGQYQQASEEFRAALTYSHDNPTYRLELAKTLMQLGQWDEAETHLTDLQQDDPTNSVINLMLARIDARNGQNQQAEIYYNRAIYGYWSENAEQNRISTRFELINLLDRGHEQSQAVAQLLQLVGEVPEDDFSTRLQIAGMLLSHGSTQSSADVYRGVIASEPRSAPAERGLGDAEFDLGNFADARNAYLAAARLEPSDPSLKQKVAESNTILSLDPTLVRLSATQRFNRAQDLLHRTFDAAGQCTMLPAGLSDAAQKALSEKPRRKREGDTVAMLGLAEEIWKLRSNACPKTPADPALAAIMSKIIKQ